MVITITPQVYTELSGRIQSVLKENLGKIVTAVVTMTIFTTFIGIFTLLPAMVLTGSSSALFQLVSVLLSAAAMVLSIMLMYGMFVMLGRFYCQEQAVIGHLLWGFRDAGRLISLTVLVFVTIFLLIIAEVFVFALVEGLFSIDATRYFLFAVIPVLLVSFCIFFPWAFVFPLLYHNPHNCSLRWCINQSKHLLNGNKWELLKFLLHTSWLLFVLYIASSCVVVALNLSGELSPIISQPVGMVAVVIRYMLYVKILLSLNAFYYYATETGPHAAIPMAEENETVFLESSCESASDTPAQN